MSTRALIVGKVDGKIKYGQSKYDGYQNTEWLQKNLNEEPKVKEFFKYLTEGGEDGKGHGICSFNFGSCDIDWKEGSYFCNIVENWDFAYSDLRGKRFDFPEYISYWDGIEWHDFVVSEDYDKFLEKINE